MTSPLVKVAAGAVAGSEAPPFSGPPTANARGAEHPVEDFGWLGFTTSKFYRALVAAGWPVIDCNAGPLGKLSGVLLQYHLDGSGWLMTWSGATIRVPDDVLGQPPTSMCSPSEARAWQPVNLHQLTTSQIKVLLAISGPVSMTAEIAGPRAAGAGLIDEEIAAATDLAVSTVQHLRGDLVHKCLVIGKQGPYALRETSAGTRAQVWVITGAGELALRPPSPSTELLATWLERHQIEPPSG